MKRLTFESQLIKICEYASRVIALLVAIVLLVASVIVLVDTIQVLAAHQIDKAIQDILFVLILLEMFYIARSFIKYGTINVGIVVNVGIIAAVKEMIFQIGSLNWQLATAFGIIFISLSLVYLAETIHFQQKQ